MKSSSAIVDLSFLENFTKGDINKQKQYIKLYLKTASHLFSELKEHCDKNEWHELYVKAHSLKPQVLYMGIPTLQKKLVQIEEIAKQKGNKENLPDLVQISVDINNRAMEELKISIEE